MERVCTLNVFFNDGNDYSCLDETYEDGESVEYYYEIKGDFLFIKNITRYPDGDIGEYTVAYATSNIKSFNFTLYEEEPEEDVDDAIDKARKEGMLNELDGPADSSYIIGIMGIVFFFAIMYKCFM